MIFCSVKDPPAPRMVKNLAIAMVSKEIVIPQPIIILACVRLLGVWPIKRPPDAREMPTKNGRAPAIGAMIARIAANSESKNV